MSDASPRIPPLVAVPLRFGVIGGVVGFALMLVLYFVGIHPFLVFPLLDFRIVLFAVFLAFGLKELRDYNFNGVLYFWQGMIACFIIVIFYAVIASGLLWLFATLVPQFVESFVTQSMDRLRSSPPELIERIGKQQFEQIQATLPGTSAFDLALDYFGKCFIISLFISIIISVILRRQPQTV